MQINELPHALAQQIQADTKHWLSAAVIGLSLCPFAKPVYLKNRVHFCISAAETWAELRAVLTAELLALQQCERTERETTLIVHPRVLVDFVEYNSFLAEADATLDKLDLVGVIQVASFHPQYQFADSQTDAVENYSNRSPYPMLHLLREVGIDEAVDRNADVDSIPERNIATLKKLGIEGWQALNVGPKVG